MIERLRLLRSWGVEVQVHIGLPKSDEEGAKRFLQDFGTPLLGDSYVVDDISCRVTFDPAFHPHLLAAQPAMEKFFFGVLNREWPDLVWAHYTDFFATTAALQWSVEQSWVDLTDNEFPRIDQLAMAPSVQRHYRSIRHMMVASRFMKNSAHESFPASEIHLLPNIIESLQGPPVERSPKAWVFVNPTPVKGAEFAVQLANALPKEEFNFVGNWTLDAPRALPANVKFTPRQNSLRPVFSYAKGVLMPSVWEEAFGRIPLEAMAMGVPVISSNRGALPETVGEGGLCLPLELDRWVKAMRETEDFWHRYVEKGAERVRKYQRDISKSYSELKEQLQKFL